MQHIRVPLPNGTRVVHKLTGEIGSILGSGYSPAGVPNYRVFSDTTQRVTWWYRSDVS